VKVLRSPLQSLESGRWFKLICGASYQYAPAVRDLSLAYALAGADCIDVAADPAVVAAARAGLAAAERVAIAAGVPYRQPWLMVSLNDGEDPHFRKATFDPASCPSDCPRPCERVCPAAAIRWEEAAGVIDERCYGCGRCLPVCPLQHISTRHRQIPPARLAALLADLAPDALELHTQVGRASEFAQLWAAIAPALPHLQLLAVSCPQAPGAIAYLQAIAERIDPPCPLIWQTDGRPMSGDLGAGTTRAAIQYARAAIAAGLPGYIQLAGGTNQHTVPKLRALDLLGPGKVAGVAYGSYARARLAALTDCQPSPYSAPEMPPAPLEAEPERLWRTVARARELVHPLAAAPAPAEQPVLSTRR